MMSNKRKEINNLIRRQNLKSVPVALLCFVLIIPITLIMIVGCPFALLFSLLTFNPMAFVESYETAVFIPWRNIVKTFWFSIFPNTYSINGLAFNELKEGKLPQIKREGIYHWAGFLLIKERMSFNIIPAANIVWIYWQNEKNSYRMKYSAQPVAMSMRNSIVLKTDKGKQFNITIDEIGPFSLTIKSKMDITTVPEICDLCKNAFVGYSVERAKIYRRSPKNFVEAMKKMEN